MRAQVRLQGVGGISADAAKPAANVWQGAATFAASGSFHPNAYVPTQAIVSFAEFELTVSDRTLEVRFNGVGNLSAYANLRAQIQVNYQGTGNLSVLAAHQKVAAAIFSWHRQSISRCETHHSGSCDVCWCR